MIVLYKHSTDVVWWCVGPLSSLISVKWAGCPDGLSTGRLTAQNHAHPTLSTICTWLSVKFGSTISQLLLNYFSNIYHQLFLNYCWNIALLLFNYFSTIDQLMINYWSTISQLMINYWSTYFNLAFQHPTSYGWLATQKISQLSLCSKWPTKALPAGLKSWRKLRGNFWSNFWWKLQRERLLGGSWAVCWLLCEETFGVELMCVFGWLFKALTHSHWSHLFDFSSLCLGATFAAGCWAVCWLCEETFRVELMWGYISACLWTAWLTRRLSTVFH